MGILDWWIQPAMAAAAGPGMGGHNALSSVLMMAGFIFIFYFFIWRPQSKRAKEHRTLLTGLNKGDEVVTSGGVVGKIMQMNENFVVLEIAENTQITVQKPAVSQVMPKGTLKSMW